MAAPYYNRKNAQTNQLSKCFEVNNLEARAKRDKSINHQSEHADFMNPKHYKVSIEIDTQTIKKNMKKKE